MNKYVLTGSNGEEYDLYYEYNIPFESDLTEMELTIRFKQNGGIVLSHDFIKYTPSADIMTLENWFQYQKCIFQK